MDSLQAIRKRVNDWLHDHIRAEDKYKGLAVKSIDGSTMQLDDTAQNQMLYPQPTSQKRGCGFPVMGIMGVRNHAHGGWEDFAVGAHTAHDAPIAHKLLGCFRRDDLVCADRAFCSYELIACIARRGTHSLMRLHQARHRVLGFRRGKRMGPNERLVTWKKPVVQPTASPLNKDEWKALPGTMSVRLIRFEYKDRAGKDIRLMSFKGTLDTVVTASSRYTGRQKHRHVIRRIWQETIETVAEKVINWRPYRHEPRAVKRRTKSYGYMTLPRSEFCEIPHKGKHRSYA